MCPQCFSLTRNCCSLNVTSLLILLPSFHYSFPQFHGVADQLYATVVTTALCITFVLEDRYSDRGFHVSCSCKYNTRSCDLHYYFNWTFKIAPIFTVDLASFRLKAAVQAYSHFTYNVLLYATVWYVLSKHDSSSQRGKTLRICTIISEIHWRLL